MAAIITWTVAVVLLLASVGLLVWILVDVLAPRKIWTPHGLRNPPNNLDLLRARKEYRAENAENSKENDEKCESG